MDPGRVAAGSTRHGVLWPLRLVSLPGRLVTGQWRIAELTPGAGQE